MENKIRINHFSAEKAEMERRTREIADSLVVFQDRFMLLVGAANSMVGDILKDTLDALRRDRAHVNGALLSYMRDAMESYYAVERRMLSVHGVSGGILLDYLDAHDEFMRTHVEILRMSTLRLLERKGIENATLLSMMLTTYTLADYATELLERTCARLRKTLPGYYVRTFEDMSLRKVRDLMVRCVNKLEKDNREVIDLNGDDAFRNAMMVIEAKMSDFDIVRKLEIDTLTLSNGSAERQLGKERCEEIVKSMNIGMK